MPAAQGTAVVDFGAYPGTDVAEVAVTGQAALTAGARADAWLIAEPTADHSEDEHVMLKGAIDVVVKRSTIVAATGFVITATCSDSSGMWGQLNVDWAWAV